MTRTAHLTTKLLLATAFALGLGAAAPARAYQVFVNVDGMPGDSTTAGYVGSIAAMSFAWNVSQAVTGTMSSTGSIAGQRAAFAPFTITKVLDRASVPLALASATGQVLRTVVVSVVNGRGQTSALFKLSNVIVSNVSQSAAASADDTGMVEEVSFAFGKIDITTYTYDPNGRATAAQRQGWDVQSNRRL